MEEQESGNNITAVLPVQLLWLLVTNLCVLVCWFCTIAALAGPSLWAVSDVSWNRSVEGMANKINDGCTSSACGKVIAGKWQENIKLR